MSNYIVTTNISVTSPPAPSQLQRTGAFLSQGGTNTPPGTLSLLTQTADLTPLLQSTAQLASLAQTGGLATATLPSTTISSGTYNATTGLVTLTLAATLNLSPGMLVTIASATGTGSYASIDGTWQAGVGTTGTTLTFTIAAALTMTITGGAVNATTGQANGAVFWTTIAGATPAAYNGTVLATVASATTFTYAVPSGTAGSATGTITYTVRDVQALTQMANTFFAQSGAPSPISVYVLELGAGTPAQGVTYLTSWIAANPNVIYAYLTQRSWASEATYLTFVAGFEALTSKTYFFTTMTLSNYTSFTAQMKCVLGLIEAPGLPPTEFTLAAPFYVLLNYNPSSTNRVTPFQFSFLYGVTQYPIVGNSALLATLKAAFVNLALSGSEGGLSNTILKWGTMMDGNVLNYWYAIDWVNINGSQAVANAVIEGSNNSLAPLYYNQTGINQLQRVLASVLGQGVAAGILLGQVTLLGLDAPVFSDNVAALDYAGLTAINAVPFILYTNENPTAYKAGSYGGLQVAMTPQLGFSQIIINIDVVTFV